MHHSPHEFRAQSLTKAFGTRVVLDSIGFDLPRGSLVAIVGGSGSGKTVLLHLLAGLMRATSGRVLAANHSLAGAPLADLSALSHDELDDVRRHWAFVFQRNALFSGSVLDNFAFMLREHDGLGEGEILARARASLAACALDVDDVLHKDRDELSGGMAKRVAIARAIALDPAVIFYDEPTTGLDPVVAAHMHDLVWATHHRPTLAGLSRTTIVVTHDRDLLRRLHPRVIMLHDRRACFDGAYESFAAQTSGPPRDYLQAMPILQARPQNGA